MGKQMSAQIYALLIVLALVLTAVCLWSGPTLVVQEIRGENCGIMAQTPQEIGLTTP
jgi:hypothetical protein